MTHTTAQPERSSRAATARPTVTLTGVQPTGDLRLGNSACTATWCSWPPTSSRSTPTIAVDLAQQFSRGYRPGVLREPRALIAQTTATLPGLDGRKMSKSYGNAISLMAEPDDMRKQIRRIVTDSTPPGQPKDPDTCTLVALLRAFADRGTVAAVEERYRTGRIGYGEVKARLADAIDAHVAPMRNRYQRLLTDPAELDARLARGEQHACQRADRTLARTVVAMGL